ncbi:unnamed protein product [Urochloa humidicola]
MADSKKDESSSPPLHVVVFPWLAFGHIIPFLELSEQLAKRGHFVTFVSAPRNLARLRPVAPELKPRIRLAPLPLPAVEGLPEAAESTADVRPEKVELLKVAFDGGFFTHAGMSSLVESFLFGHPLVMLPLFADQGLTARVMAERRVGVEVPWRVDGGAAFASEDVAAAVRRVMAADEEEEGEVFRRNAGELKEVLWDMARQERYIDELVEHLLQRRTV